MDAMQFAYWTNRSVDDTVNLGLHFILQHVDSRGSNARILLTDFSSAFNTIVPELLHTKLSQLTVPEPLCVRITNFLTDRKQRVTLGKNTVTPLTVNTGAPQGCELSPLLYCLYTNDRTSTSSSSSQMTQPSLV